MELGLYFKPLCLPTKYLQSNRKGVRTAKLATSHLTNTISTTNNSIDQTEQANKINYTHVKCLFRISYNLHASFNLVVLAYSSC
jgi:hypothetical protein